MKGILFLIVPPLVGALIGYTTNLVAIKMLFRPLAEIRLFGLRLPFTPGILPKERHKLADSIGIMVEHELLTPGVLRERLAGTEVREKIENALGAYSNQLLERPFSYWLEDRPEDFPLAEIAYNFVNSEVFDSFLGFWLKSRFRDFGSVFVSPALVGIIKNGIAREIRKHGKGEPSSFRQALESVIEKYPGLTLGEFLSLGKTKKQQADSFLAEKTIGALDENIDSALSAINVKILVSDRINSLDMLRVEKIILDVMAGQLKWINYFGAILGALIGFVQVLLSFFIG